DVGRGADRHGEVGQSAGARDPGVDVDDRRALPLRLHDPLEAYRMALGHVGPLDDDAVAIREVLLERGGAASSERGPQTGDRGAVSYTGLVLDLDHAQRREQLLDEVVLLVVEGGAAEVRHGERPVERLALLVPGLP